MFVPLTDTPHPHWLKSSLSLSPSSTCHPCAVVLDSLRPLLLLPPALPRLLLSFLFMYSDDLDSVTNNLRDSAKGSNDGYDVAFPLTGYEPNDTELNNGTELNDSVHSKFFDCQDPSSTLLRHWTRTWLTLRSASYSLKYTEITPITEVR